MKLYIDKDSEVTINYTSCYYGKIVLDISSENALSILGQIIDEKGIMALVSHLSKDDAEELLEALKGNE